MGTFFKALRPNSSSSFDKASVSHMPCFIRGSEVYINMNHKEKGFEVQRLSSSSKDHLVSRPKGGSCSMLLGARKLCGFGGFEESHVLSIRISSSEPHGLGA